MYAELPINCFLEGFFGLWVGSGPRGRPGSPMKHTRLFSRLVLALVTPLLVTPGLAAQAASIQMNLYGQMVVYLRLNGVTPPASPRP